MQIYQLSAAEALQTLHSGPAGLSGAEADRLREFGPNSVERVRGTPLFLRFLKGFCHFFALILWVAAGLAFLAEWQDPGAGMATLGFAMLGVILVNGLFSFWQEYRAERMEAERRNSVVHSHSAVLSAGQESGGREQAEGLRLVPCPDQEFHGFLEAAPDAVVIADRDGRIIRVNSQAE